MRVPQLCASSEKFGGETNFETVSQQQEKAGGAFAREKAGQVRFLPVLLTSITAIGGLTPLAFWGGALYAPLAAIIIGGLISSTLLSRVVTPAMYLLVARRDEENKNANGGASAPA